LHYSSRMAYQQSAMVLCDNEHVGTMTDEMQVLWRCQRPCFKPFPDHPIGEVSLDTFTVSTPANTFLTGGYITPCEELMKSPSGASRAIFGSAFPVPEITYTTCKALWWRGDMNVRFTFATTESHSFRVGCFLNYGVSTIPATVPEISDQFSVIFDVSGDNTTFTVPLKFITNRDWLKVPNGALTDPADSTCGVWSLWLLNTVVCPGPTLVTQTISYWMDFWAGDNYQIDESGLNNVSVVSAWTQAGTEAVVSSEAPHPIVAAASTGKSVGPAFQHFGTPGLTSIKRMLKRMQIVHLGVDQMQINLETQTNTATRFAMFVGAHHLSSLLKTAGLITYFGKTYRAMRGSLKIRVLSGISSTTASGGTNTAVDVQDRLFLLYDPSTTTNTWTDLNSDDAINQDINSFAQYFPNQLPAAAAGGTTYILPPVLPAINAFYPQGVISPAYNYTGIEIAPAIDMTDKYAPVSYIEVGMPTSHQFVILAKDAPARDQFAGNYYSDLRDFPGSIVIGALGDSSKSWTVQTPYNQVNHDYQIALAFADDTRYFSYVGPTGLAIAYIDPPSGSNYAIYPDTYTAT